MFDVPYRPGFDVHGWYKDTPNYQPVVLLHPDGNLYFQCPCYIGEHVMEPGLYGGHREYCYGCLIKRDGVLYRAERFYCNKDTLYQKALTPSHLLSLMRWLNNEQQDNSDRGWEVAKQPTSTKACDTRKEHDHAGERPHKQVAGNVEENPKPEKERTRAEETNERHFAAFIRHFYRDRLPRLSEGPIMRREHSPVQPIERNAAVQEMRTESDVQGDTRRSVGNVPTVSGDRSEDAGCGDS